MARRRRLLWKLYPTYLVVILLCTAGLGAVALPFFKAFYEEQTADRLLDTAHLVAGELAEHFPALDRDGVAALCNSRGKVADARLTVILTSGEVLGDSEENPDRMENHANRPEVKEALATGQGTAIRYSATLGVHMMYVAIPLKRDGQVAAVVRAAVPLEAVNRALAAVYLRVLMGGAVVALVAAGVGMLVSRRISGPLKEMKVGADRFAVGNFEHKVLVPETEELAGLAETLNRMAAQLDEKIRIMARQQQEQEAILASMVEGVLAVDAGGRVLSLNQAAAAMLGAEPHAAVGRPIQEVVRNADLERLLTAVLEGGESAEGEVTLRLDVDRVFQVRGAPLRDADGREIGALVVLHDVTRLARLETMRRDFVANVSHELKTPITSIQGFIETLREGAVNDPAKAAQFLEILARQADRLNALIEDLLSLSRIERESEAQRVERQKTDLREVVEAAAADCSPRASERGITVRVGAPDALWADVDARMIEQAVANLLDNAIKFSEQGSVVEVEAEEDGKERRVRVRDRGCGIAPEHLDRIFERFYRVDKGRSRDLGGTGLGLAIVKHIMQAHGGRVSVQSVPGQGSTFTLHLPTA
jgi:two-component system phosphate regulon sensor histidine kinase PhoR